MQTAYKAASASKNPNLHLVTTKICSKPSQNVSMISLDGIFNKKCQPLAHPCFCGATILRRIDESYRSPKGLGLPYRDAVHATLGNNTRSKDRRSVGYGKGTDTEGN